MTDPKVLHVVRDCRDGIPSNAVYIGRRTGRLAGSKWGNPFVIDKPNKPRDGTRAEVIAKYREWICDQPELMTALPELRGKDLVCWCAPDPCHGHVLLVLANTEEGVV
jgi:hypothetical protein